MHSYLKQVWNFVLTPVGIDGDVAEIVEDAYQKIKDKIK